jgi:hypothetical protein
MRVQPGPQNFRIVITEESLIPETIYLDQAYYPWRVYNIVNIGLKQYRTTLQGARPGPLPPHEINEINPFKEAELRGEFMRLCDYASQIEALDIRIKGYHGPNLGTSRPTGWVLLGNSKLDEATIEDERGWVWGPMTLDLMKEPTPEPLPVKRGDIELVPERHGYNVMRGKLHFWLERLEAFAFAETWATAGLEKALTTFLPHGHRLSIVGRTVPEHLVVG